MLAINAHQDLSFQENLYLYLLFPVFVFAAGSSGDGDSSKTKTNYEIAVSFVKKAKNFEKNGKTDKATKNYKEDELI